MWVCVCMLGCVCVCVHARCCSILDGLLAQLEGEDGGELLVATLCLLEASAAGLLEMELRTLLADESVLRPPSPYEEKGWLLGKVQQFYHLCVCAEEMVREWTCVCVCVCVHAEEIESSPMCVCVCVEEMVREINCVCLFRGNGQRAHVCVCVCVCV